MDRIARLGRRPFRFTLFVSLLFVVLTVAAMLLYPGGTVADPQTQGYRFLDNFFSDLGRTATPGGQANTASLVLFAVALAAGGAGLVAYFVAAPFSFRRPRTALGVSLAGSALGALTGLCFIGVACTPADRLLGPHVWFVLTAFRSFLGAAVCYAAAILIAPGVSRRYAAVYGLFALLLAGYIALLTAGPGLGTTAGVRIQATGQKVIVYAAVLCMAVQSYGASRGMDQA